MGLDFSLDEGQLALRAGARQFADGVLSGVAAALADIPGPEERFYAIKPFYQQMVDAGFLKALIPDEYGGNKFTSLAFVLAAEELARVDINTPTAVLATGLGLQPIIHFGTPEQKNASCARSPAANRGWLRSGSPRSPAAPISTRSTPWSVSRPSPSSTGTSG